IRHSTLWPPRGTRSSREPCGLLYRNSFTVPVSTTSVSGENITLGAAWWANAGKAAAPVSATAVIATPAANANFLLNTIYSLLVCRDRRGNTPRAHARDVGIAPPRRQASGA